jgi:apolipoprotein N-acyltransferase
LVGVIYFGVGLYWVWFFDLKAYFLAVLVTAPIFAVYFSILCFVRSRVKSPVALIFAALAIWVLIQAAYAMSPVGAIAIEVPFYAPLPFFQIAKVTGFALLPFLILGLNVCIALAIKKRSKLAVLGIFLFSAGLAGVFFFGQSELKKSYSTPLRWAVIQHNLPVSGTWRLDHPLFVRSKYRELALEAAKEKPAMIIFPLYSFPDDALRNPEFFSGLAKETNAWILVATYIPQKEGESITQGFFDAALLYSPEGKLVDHYRAVKAPPFRNISEKNESQYKILETPFGKLGILLCYEDGLPRVAREAVRNGADILIALSNPGFFNKTWMPYYHLMQDRLRAIETERFVVRASSNGYSGVIDPKGRVLSQSELDREQILRVNVGRRGTTI